MNDISALVPPDLRIEFILSEIKIQGEFIETRAFAFGSSRQFGLEFYRFALKTCFPQNDTINQTPYTRRSPKSRVLCLKKRTEKLVDLTMSVLGCRNFLAKKINV